LVLEVLSTSWNKSHQKIEENLTVHISRSIERKKQPIVKQLIVAAALFISIALGSSSAIAQSTDSTAAKTVTLFSNLGPSSTDLYFSGVSAGGTSGDCIKGAGASGSTFCGRFTGETWQAMPFTPKQNSHATELEAAVGFFAGTNQFLLALFNDDNGVPGTALATVTVTNAPPESTCCTLDTASLGTPGIALTAGTQYWVVVQTDDVNASDFEGTWAFSNNGPAIHELQGGQPEWRFSGGNLAFAVLGTTP
jgi:hypothetical protein